jgi:peptide/nickel transport system substrate-binding protein
MQIMTGLRAATAVAAMRFMLACVAAVTAATLAMPSSFAEPVDRTLVVALPGLNSEVFGPHRAGGAEQFVLYTVGEPLLRANRKTRAPEANLVTSWKVSDDLTTWTFKLRPDVQFHDGYGNLTAEDVKFTWSLFLRDDAIHSRSSAYRDAVNNDMNNFEIMDDLTFRIHGPANAILPSILVDSTQVMTIVSKKYWEKVGDEAAMQHPIGTGPWKFTGHVPGASVSFEAVRDHWRKPPEFARMEFRIIPDAVAALAQVRAGETDMAAIDLNLLPEAQAAGMKVVSIPSIGMASLYFGGFYPGTDSYDKDSPWVQASAPEKGLAIRNAMSLAIDRDSIVNDLLLGQGIPGNGPILYQPGFVFTHPSWKVPKQNIEEAKKLLAEGGYPDGFELNLVSYPQGGRPYGQDIAEAIANMLEDIGLKVNRAVIQEGQFDEMRENRSSNGVIWSYIQSTGNEPGIQLTGLNPSDSGAEFYFEPVDRLLPEALKEPDFDKRVALYKEIGKSFIDFVGPAVGVASVNSQWVLSENVADWGYLTGSAEINSTEYVTPAAQ